MKTKKVAVVICCPGQSPMPETWEVSNPEEELRHAQESVGGHVEIVPYPIHLNQPKLSVVVNEDALQRNLPYNRWGLAGNFFVAQFDVHGRHQSLSAKALEQVLHDLEVGIGYLDEASEVRNSYREQGMDREPPPDPFFFTNPNWLDYFQQGKTRRSLPAKEFESQGGDWHPQLHFTGVENIDDFRFIESLLDEYANHIEAHHFSFPLPGTYSVELQFGTSEEDQGAMVDCRQRYLDQFKGETD